MPETEPYELIFTKQQKHHLAAFACGLATHDLVAPVRGTRRLVDYLQPDRSTVAA